MSFVSISFNLMNSNKRGRNNFTCSTIWNAVRLEIFDRNYCGSVKKVYVLMFRGKAGIKNADRGKKKVWIISFGFDLLSLVLFDTITPDWSRIRLLFSLCLHFTRSCTKTNIQPYLFVIKFVFRPLRIRYVCLWADMFGISRYLEKRLCIKSQTTK